MINLRDPVVTVIRIRIGGEEIIHYGSARANSGRPEADEIVRNRVRRDAEGVQDTEALAYPRRRKRRHGSSVRRIRHLVFARQEVEGLVFDDGSAPREA